MLLWIAFIILVVLDCTTANPPYYLRNYNFIPSNQVISQVYPPNNYGTYSNSASSYYPLKQQVIQQNYYKNQPANSQNYYPIIQQEYHSSFHPSRQELYPRQAHQQQYTSHVNTIKQNIIEIKPSWTPEYASNYVETWSSYSPKYHLQPPPHDYHAPPPAKVIVPDHPPPKYEKVVSPPPPPRLKYPDVKTLKKYSDHKSKDKFLYKFGYQQSDGQTREEQGDLVNPNGSDEHLSVKGSYGWMGPDGVNYTVDYTADENGFQPNISQGPGGGVPPAVVASLLG